jgi:hypothetical protein
VYSPAARRNNTEAQKKHLEHFASELSDLLHCLKADAIAQITGPAATR